MPVWKYRSIDAMPRTPCYEPGSEEHLRQWAALWARATAIAGKTFQPGVLRFRSVEESRRAAADVHTTAR